MIRIMVSVVISAATLTVAFAGLVRADDKQPTGQMTDERQAWLLERLGDEGIDADGDGTLTREEVRAFFAKKHGEGTRGDGEHAWRGKHGQWGEHGQWGKQDRSGEHSRWGKHPFGRRGMEGHQGDKMHRLGMTLHHLDVFAAETPPEQFDIAGHEEADLDGDGELSQTEWQTFAQGKRSEILSRLASRLPDADGDSDGTLNDEELEAVIAKFHAQLLEKHPEADANGDGVLSAEEAAAFHAGHFEERRAQILEHHPEADADGDGTLSDQEMHQFGAGKHGQGWPGGRGGHGCGHGHGGGKVHGDKTHDFPAGHRSHGGQKGEGRGGCPHGPKT